MDHSCQYHDPACSSSQGLREKIDSRLTKVQEIRFEPRLLAGEDDRLTHASHMSKQVTYVSVCRVVVAVSVQYTCCLWVIGGMRVVIQRLLQLPVQNESPGRHP